MTTTIRPTVTEVIDAEIKSGYVAYYKTRGEATYLSDGDEFTYHGDTMSDNGLEYIRELVSGHRYRFLGTTVDEVMLSDTETGDRVFLFKETFRHVLVNCLVEIHTGADR